MVGSDEDEKDEDYRFHSTIISILSPSKSLISSLWKNSSLCFITGFFVVPSMGFALMEIISDHDENVAPEKMIIHLHAAPVPCYRGLEF